VRHAINADSIDSQQQVTTLQSTINCRRTVWKDVLDDDRKVASIAAEPADNSEAKAVSSTLQRDLSQRLADRTTVIFTNAV